MTSGFKIGTGGAGLSPFRVGWAATALFVAGLQTLTVLSSLHHLDARPWWEPVVDEYSSGAVVLALYPLVWWAAVRVPPGRPWPRFVAGQVAANAVYAALHIGAFTGLRIIAYAALGGRYETGGWPQAAYEYRKDAVAYALVIASIWAIRRLMSARSAEATEATPGDRKLFPIRDGSRVFRTPVEDIIAVRSAGNYAEFHLADGRRRLMRATLSSLAGELEAYGFVRTHRSWIINPAHVRVAEPEGSGDYRLMLDGGGEAPLSRRFPEARAAILG